MAEKKAFELELGLVGVGLVPQQVGVVVHLEHERRRLGLKQARAHTDMTSQASKGSLSLSLSLSLVSSIVPAAKGLSTDHP